MIKPNKGKLQMKRVLLGLVRVIGPLDNPILDGCKGAYVNVVARARNEIEFSKIVITKAEEIGLIVDHIEWIEMMVDRLRKFVIEEYVIKLAQEVEKEGGCRFGVFHAWEED